MPRLPPGPTTPAVLQTIDWIVKPTTLLRKAQARYGDVFTLHTVWYDAPLVCLSDPAQIQAVYKAPPDVLQGGDAASLLEPFVGAHSVLILSGDEHLRQRRLALPPFHGDALKRWTQTIAQLAHAELDSWEPGAPIAAITRMQALALEVIQRVVFGSRDPELKAALRAALDMTGSTARLITMSLTERGPYQRFLRAVRRIDELVYAHIDEPAQG